MIEDIYKMTDILKSENSLEDIEKLTNIIIEKFKNEILDSSDGVLLNLVFKYKPKQEDLDECLNNYDIEVAGGHKALMLAYFMKMHPELKYPDYVAPRLKGLLQFYRFNNIKLVSHFVKIGSELRKAKINFLILKGGCMKYLRPEYPRVMGDIDILVQKKDYKKSGYIVEKLGYVPYWHIHSIDVHPKGSEEGILDIHKFIPMNSEKEKSIIKDLFKRATKQKVFGIETFVPCNEDMFFLSLINMVRNLKDKTSYAGILYNLFDCKFLIESKSNFNWDIVLQNAQKTDTIPNIYFAVQYINNIVPNLLPNKIKKDNKFQKEFRNYCILLIYQRFYLWNMKQKSHQMKIKDFFSSWEFFKEYLKLKPKYFILKLGIIRKNPYLAEKILKKASLYEN